MPAPLVANDTRTGCETEGNLQSCLSNVDRQVSIEMTSKNVLSAMHKFDQGTDLSQTMSREDADAWTYRFILKYCPVLDTTNSFSWVYFRGGKCEYHKDGDTTMSFVYNRYADNRIVSYQSLTSSCAVPEITSSISYCPEGYGIDIYESSLSFKFSVSRVH